MNWVPWVQWPKGGSEETQTRDSNVSCANAQSGTVDGENVTYGTHARTGARIPRLSDLEPASDDKLDHRGNDNQRRCGLRVPNQSERQMCIVQATRKPAQRAADLTVTKRIVKSYHGARGSSVRTILLISQLPGSQWHGTCRNTLLLQRHCRQTSVCVTKIAKSDKPPSKRPHDQGKAGTGVFPRDNKKPLCDALLGNSLKRKQTPSLLQRLPQFVRPTGGVSNGC